MPKTATSDAITLAEAIALISDDGRKQLVDLVRQARKERGSGFIKALKKEYPRFTSFIDLVANHTAEECYTELEKEFGGVSLIIFKRQIFMLHDALKAEIDKPR